MEFMNMAIECQNFEPDHSIFLCWICLHSSGFNLNNVKEFLKDKVRPVMYFLFNRSLKLQNERQKIFRHTSFFSIIINIGKMKFFVVKSLYIHCYLIIFFTVHQDFFLSL